MHDLNNQQYYKSINNKMLLKLFVKQNENERSQPILMILWNDFLATKYY